MKQTMKQLNMKQLTMTLQNGCFCRSYRRIRMIRDFQVQSLSACQYPRPIWLIATALGMWLVTNGVLEAQRPALDVPIFRLAPEQVADTPSASQPSQSEKTSKSAGKDATGDSPTTQTSAVDRGPLPSFGDTLWRDLKEAPGLLWHDTKKVYGNAGNLIFLLGAGGVSAALRPEVDDDIDDHYERHHTFSGDWPDTIGVFGNPYLHFSLAGLWYLVGQQAQDIKTYEVGKRAVSALIINGVSIELLKLAACTKSANGEDWAWPSGHVSSSMAVATVLNHAYGPLVGIPMYGLTGLVAVERIDDREHSLSDVVFGAAMGWVIAETVMKEHRPEIFGGQIVPYADAMNNNAGIAWVKTLGQ